MPRARIIAAGVTNLNNPKSIGVPVTATNLMSYALKQALDSANLRISDLDGLIAVPSLAEPRFMQAHYLASSIGLLPRKGVVCKTVDTGGASPVTGLLDAKSMIQNYNLKLVAVVAGDAVKSLPTEEFLNRADMACENPNLPSPVIPSAYDIIAQYQCKKYGLKREQLAMWYVSSESVLQVISSSLMSMMGSRHPNALSFGKNPLTMENVLSSKSVAPITTVAECARRADGAGAVIVASTDYIESHRLPNGPGVEIVSGGEGSGPLIPYTSVKDVSEEMFSLAHAVQLAFQTSGLSTKDIDYFGLYDCFPICLIKAIEAVGLARTGEGGNYIEAKYEKLNMNLNKPGYRPQDDFPVNTHGGLLGYGAPWEAPAMFNIIESFLQLTDQAGDRQIKDAKKALVYGNGGVFTSSAVAILSR